MFLLEKMIIEFFFGGMTKGEAISRTKYADVSQKVGNYDEEKIKDYSYTLLLQ